MHFHLLNLGNLHLGTEVTWKRSRSTTRHIVLSSFGCGGEGGRLRADVIIPTKRVRSCVEGPPRVVLSRFQTKQGTEVTGVNMHTLMNKSVLCCVKG